MFTESLDSFIFLDFWISMVFLDVLGTRRIQKTLGNVWILLMSLVKIIIFSRFFLILL